MRVATRAIAGIGCMVPLLALAAPAELLNKTVTVSYTVTIPAKAPDGSTVPGVRNATRTIYISSTGRAFARVSRQDGRLSETKDVAPGDAPNTLRFQGDKLAA